jgi:transposase
VLRHVEEISGNVAATCRYYGVSRNCYYKWLRRYEPEGLEELKDRSSRPHFSPRATSVEVVEKIVWLRKHYHFGPAKIAMYLRRYHDVPVSKSGVWRVLNRLEMNRLPTSQRPGMIGYTLPEIRRLLISLSAGLLTRPEGVWS